MPTMQPSVLAAADRRDGTLLLAIHGVGDPTRGANAEALAAAVQAAGYQVAVREVHWNGWVDDRPDFVALGNVLGYVAKLGLALMHCVCLPVSSPGQSRWARAAARLVEAIAPFCAVATAFPVLALALWALGLSSWTTSLGIPLLVAVLGGGAATAVGALSCDRRVFWASVRVLLLPLIWGPLAAALLLSALPWAWIIAIALGFLLYFLLLGWLRPEFRPSVLFSRRSQAPALSFWYEHTVGVVLCAIAGAAVFAAMSVINPILEWIHRSGLQSPTKVLGDILFYLGRPSYRQALIRRCVEEIDQASMSGVATLVLCAHSLGTVIASDSLCLLAPDASRARIVLISAGSPLRRIFWRFFAASFPPPSELARFLGERHQGFRWLNVYRPLDYVGGRLGLSAGSESSTGQLLRFHGNYWSDRRPVATAARLLTTDALPVSGACAQIRMPEADGFRGLARFRRVAFAISFAALLVAIFVRLPILALRREAATYAAAKRFLLSPAKVTTDEIVRFRAGSVGGYWMHKNGVAYDIEVVGKHPDAEGMQTINPYLVDLHELSRLVRTRGNVIGEFGGKPVYQLRLQIATLADDPTSYSIIDPALPTPSRFGWMFRAVTIGALFAMLAWYRHGLAKWVLVPTLGFFFGSDAGESVASWVSRD